MDGIPPPLLSRFLCHLKQSRIPESDHAEYLQLLRYYLAFCDKYSPPDSRSERVRLFCEKLREKKQATNRLHRAAHAISLYFAMLKQERSAVFSCIEVPSSSDTHSERNAFRIEPNPECPIPASSEVSLSVSETRPVSTHQLLRTSNYLEAGYQVKSDSPEWDAVLERLAAEIKVRHYARKTLQTYANWARQFQRFLKNKRPEELSSDDVKEYLTFLAVKCNVAAATQNQAFNSLLFLYRHALKKEFGILNGVPRAKKSLYVPMVLSREEIDAILNELSYTYRLFVSLLFGCGLRLFECQQLRVRDFNFDANLLTIHGKGKKDRTVPLPETILSELKAQIASMGQLHDQDVAAGYDGVFLDDALEKKYPAAPKEFIQVLSAENSDGCYGNRTTEALPPTRIRNTGRPLPRRASCKNPETCHRPHLSPLLCHPSLAGKLRHPRHPDTARTRKP